MSPLLLLWWTSLLLAAIAILWMIGLIVARLFRQNDETRRAADRKALASAYLAIMGGADDPTIVLRPFQRRARLLAETLLEVLGLVRGAERERLIGSLERCGVDQRLRWRLTRGSRTGRLASAEALSAFPSVETRAALESLYHNAGDAELRIAAVRTLIEIDAPPAPEALIADLEKRHEADSLLYVPVFRRLAVDAPDAMLAAFQSGSLRSATRAVVAEALGASGDYRSLAVLLDAADAADVVLRATIIRALGALGHPGASAAVIRALADSEWDVRAEACVAASRIGSPSFAEPLARALSDPEWWVRFRAAEALSSMGALGRNALEIAAMSPVEVTRLSASLALAEMGVLL